MKSVDYAFDVGDALIEAMSGDTKIEEHQWHIAQTRVGFEGFALCGAHLMHPDGLHFQNLDHAFNNAASGGRLTCCPTCAKIAIRALEVQ